MTTVRAVIVHVNFSKDILAAIIRDFPRDVGRMFFGGLHDYGY